MKKLDDKICLECGELFHPKTSDKRFCSRQCSALYRKKHNLYKMSEEARKKLSDMHKGKPAWNKGKKNSQEQIDKFRISIANTWTEEKREKQRKKQKEIWNDQELLNKHSRIMSKVMSNEDTKAKIAESVHKYNQTITDAEWLKRYEKSELTKEKNGTAFISKGELEIKEFVESLGFKPIKYIIGQDNNRFEIDIYIPELSIGIEYNGLYYHCRNGINHRSKNYHFNKNSLAYSKGIQLIQIWEDQWKNQKEILKDIIAARLGKLRGDKIYARKCEIREISTKEYREFCMRYHVQGYRSASVKLGLYYNNELVQISSFNKARTYSISSNTQYEWEWIRGCISSNNKVIGGTSKLFKYFIDKYKPNNVLCFSDWNLFSGKGYEEAGFLDMGYTGPDKFYVTVNSALQRINRNPYAYQQYKVMVEQGKLFECYGAGSRKFIWYNEK